jgi:hypothetical protein
MFHMNQRILAANQALHAAVDTVNSSGLGQALHDLVGEVWSTNLARYAPEEHGDTTKSLGTQCYENLRELALRRFLGSEWLAPEDQWTIPGLTIATPQSVLTLTIGGVDLITKKVPYAQGRTPLWDRFPDWDAESQSRHDIARENARVLGGNALLHPAQAELELDGDARLRPGRVRRFMFVWAGDDESGATSAWLTVPVSWPGMHFAAIERLWHDETGVINVPEARPAIAAAQPTPEPVLRLKRRADREEKA